MAALAISEFRRAVDKTVRGSRPFARLAARQIVVFARCSMSSQTPAQKLQVLSPASAPGGRPLHYQRALQDVQNVYEAFFQVKRHLTEDRIAEDRSII